MVYFTPKGKELLESYKRANQKYIENFRRQRKDFTNNVPSNRIEPFPKSGNEGLYGWTTRPNDGRVNIREDLFGLERLITDVHENIHTQDERETRYLVDWMLDFLRERNKYEKEHEYQR